MSLAAIVAERALSPSLPREVPAGAGPYDVVLHILTIASGAAAIGLQEVRFQESGEAAEESRVNGNSYDDFDLYVFDADGTLRRCTVPGQPCPNSHDEWELIDGVRERLAAIDWDHKGFGVASNQGGVALGYLSEDTAYQLLVSLTTEATGRRPRAGTIQICSHAPNGGCVCRKPRPSMLWRIIEATDSHRSRTLYVGDLDTDRDAAEAAGCSFAWAWDFFGKTREAWTAWLAERAGASR